MSRQKTAKILGVQQAGDVLKKMNMLQLIIAFIPSTFGGIKNHIYHQAKEMLKYGHTVEVCTSNAYSRTENHGRIGTDSIDGIKVKYFKRLFHWASTIKERQTSGFTNQVLGRYGQRSCTACYLCTC